MGLKALVGAYPLLVSMTAQGLTVTTLPDYPVAKSSVNTFATPVAYRSGSLYAVDVEPGDFGLQGINLKTVVRKCLVGGPCVWLRQVIEHQTIDDTYHTQASIGLDEEGFVHVAYNMHNMPWQYVVSARPEDISEFEFRGDPVSLSQKIAVKWFNQTPFPSVGTAAIPGNQVTYPAFFNDRAGRLYLTYRFATRPRLAFKDRRFAAGLARYDAGLKRWSGLGGTIRITSMDAVIPPWGGSESHTALALTDGWQPQPVRVFFDARGGMHLAWVWRKHEGGSAFSSLSYAFSRDFGETFETAGGRGYVKPIDMSDVDVPLRNPDGSTTVQHPVVSVTATPDGTPYIAAVPVDTSTQLVSFDRTEDRWTAPAPSPFGAPRVEADDAGTLWAFATGLRVLKKDPGRPDWVEIFRDDGGVSFGYPKVLSVPGERLFVVHTMNADQGSVRIYLVRY